VEEGRYRLAQLGIFDTVETDYEVVNDHTRDLIYRVKEGKTIDFSLLFGYGSYELLRGGFEVEQNNIWGLAHHTRLKVIQSFKSSSADFTYTMPEFLGENLDVFFNGTGLLREEIDFKREEYGGGVGVHRYFRPIATDISVRYNYQVLHASDVSPNVQNIGLTNSTVGAIITELKHDRRDNPLYPRRGYKVFGTLELASEYFGGEVNYQRLELWGAWHKPLGGGRSFGVGLSHGVVLTIGSAAEDLPFNKRFFPGGENSIRGYREGEASPRDAQGRIIGAETYSLATVEFEQALTPKWSVVLFSDSVGLAQSAQEYPFDTGLFSVGGGLRWKTIIGPVRLEYGYNLNPRRNDPTGTLQFSLGFPF
jgi:outer membrane protein insertion porin family